MEEIQNETQISSEQYVEPEGTENSTDVCDEELMPEVHNPQEGESISENPSEALILGKFKSVEDLSKAYQELERRQGVSSAELGSLRKNVSELREVSRVFDLFKKSTGEIQEYLDRYKDKYNTPEYFQDPSFKEIFREAYTVLGNNLNMDRLVSLLDEYVSARIFAHDRERSAKNETEKVLDSMTYDKNSKTSFTPPKKRFDEMTPKEVDELLERLI